ncbi:MAG: Ig domain-containing protein, partial [Nitrosopumilaceae archaeon]
MFKKLVFIGFISLVILIVAPAYAIVTSITLEKDIYTDLDNIAFIGTESEGKKMVNVILYNPNGKYVNILSDPVSDEDGSFKTIPKLVESLFTTTGRYNATGFTDQRSQGITIFLNYDGERVSLIPNFVLKLVKIGNKSVTEKQTLSFTASVTDSSLKDLAFKLDKNPPTGATIDPKTGMFNWIPTEVQGPGAYLFDIVVSKGVIEDVETITVTVNDAQTIPPSTKEPEPEPEPAKKIPDFVDPKKGAQYYLDRYNDEPAYKKWFDTNFPDYTIEEAIE